MPLNTIFSVVVGWNTCLVHFKGSYSCTKAYEFCSTSFEEIILKIEYTLYDPHVGFWDVKFERQISLTHPCDLLFHRWLSLVGLIINCHGKTMMFTYTIHIFFTYFHLLGSIGFVCFTLGRGGTSKNFKNNVR